MACLDAQAQVNKTQGIHGHANTNSSNATGGNGTINCSDSSADSVNYTNAISIDRITCSNQVYTIQALKGSAGTNTVTGVEYFNFGGQLIAVKDLDFKAPTVLTLNTLDQALFKGLPLETDILTRII